MLVRETAASTSADIWVNSPAKMNNPDTISKIEPNLLLAEFSLKPFVPRYIAIPPSAIRKMVGAANRHDSRKPNVFKMIYEGMAQLYRIAGRNEVVETILADMIQLCRKPIVL